MDEDFINKDTITKTSTEKFASITVAEEYYRPGVWKIYYKLRSVDYTLPGFTRYDNTVVDPREGYPDEIKFSGKDAKERAIKYFESMVHEKS